MTLKRYIALLLAVALAAGCASNPRSSRAEKKTRATDAANTNVALATRYYSQGKVEIALEKAKRAIDLDPGNSMAHSITGVIYEVIGDSDKARRHYRKSVELDGNNPEALNNFGQFLCRNGDPEKGITYLERAVEQPFYKTPEIALISAGDCAERSDDLGRAEEFYRRALEVDDDYPDALYRLSLVMLLTGEPLKARGFLQRLEAAGILEPEVLELGARIEDALGNEKAAADYRQRMRQLYPNGAAR